MAEVGDKGDKEKYCDGSNEYLIGTMWLRWDVRSRRLWVWFRQVSQNAVDSAPDPVGVELELSLSSPPELNLP